MTIDQNIQEINRTMWSYGEYRHVADLLRPGAVELVDRLAPTPDTVHLDVATGNGNVALLSALRGSLVTGLDLTDEFFPDARERFAQAGVKVELRRGDAQELPFADASFDLVTSTYGIQFAPDHAASGGEMARVLRPGGRIGMCNWTARSWTAHFQEILSAYFPSPNGHQGQPMLWGSPDYLAELLGPEFTVASERRELFYPFTTAEDLVTFFENCFGPCIAARNTISPPSRWKELRAEMVEMTEGFHTTDERGTGVPVEYLLVTAEKRAVR
ncbi:class I SAM-dependent methyltransferase [Streptomyces sp. NBC_00257]|uniref:class I SAM-dependent methyltransferase n=1 Tax=unclassified Streptomyces TaxID=2593676 RepID=UPI0022588BD5|nr:MULTISPECIES: class I SAM-dependent methyltransferase [unclassified Streptomyces]WSW03626.1 class I SAM-dependent methyltransferase [Streptomyces sp. NBC_01005]WTC93130.1 class I SAM-dependent methyltransferase [Streptomyces sp. NBC_01650]MCX4870795.1 class I SAM-dependent methyltransferase [Streptomyces sp. NBC_00906]MCX4901535.1 class I SAM-dependent methyltransferase [Streptomyces sp. NBC_00892]MCX5426778.1 class I SAM-dependent methyltransferase [Streptomyces sp. NBC_00062]